MAALQTGMHIDGDAWESPQSVAANDLGDKTFLEELSSTLKARKTK